MLKTLFLIGSLLLSHLNSEGQTNLKSNQTPTYDELINIYTNLADSNSNCVLLEMGKTDIGKPLHLFVIAKEPIKSFDNINRGNRVFLLINNGIHPGEPDGINASIILIRELIKSSKLLENCVVGIIPVYNVGGCLNRGKNSRANQNGPEEYGFRGNAKNLDLNRDFIKSDSENAFSFARIFHFFNPHLFVDTHVSNGADYSYTMTLITSQIEKLNPKLKELAVESIEPFLYDYMKKNDSEMIPYVNSIGEKPESGLADFLETPRFATGYAALFNVLGFTTETHMLKPFPQRVQSTFSFLKAMLNYIDKNANKITETKRRADELMMQQKLFPLNYMLDTTHFENIVFKGYEGLYKKSEVSGDDRLFYDRDKPFEKEIKYFRKYNSTVEVEKPYCFVIPQGWKEVIDRMKVNNVIMHEVIRDTQLTVTKYLITNLETGKNPYEGHYLHRNIQVKEVNVKMQIYQGDIVIFTGTTKDRFLMEVLCPASVDSYFAWNFFDEILQQKEWFSDYVFEDVATEILKNNKELKEELERKKKSDEEFANDSFQQLRFVYDHSEFKEKTNNLYPIGFMERGDEPLTKIVKEIKWR